MELGQVIVGVQLLGYDDSMNAKSGRTAPVKSKKKATRIGHVYHGARPVDSLDDMDSIPRGWINPNGKFIRTKHHWSAISAQVGKGMTSDPELGERNAHKAYALGWISLGHGGILNAVGHKNTFDSILHPAVVALRKILSKVPHFSFRIERQIGKVDLDKGRHEDFDVREYDLDPFIRSGKLRKYT
jgi:hypothetical protein